ncbi:MAG: hypothetical protein QM589_17630 [Thermomicrobiales bacterium]
MEQALPGSKVEWFQDQPGYRTFHDQSKGNPANHPDLIGSLDVDYVVLQGPMLTVNFRALWEPTFQKLRERGVKIVLLSSGLFRYTKDEIEAAQRFLDAYPPDVFTSRDSDTFPHFKDVCNHTYDGIESAFCVPDAFKPYRLDMPESVALCFDRYPEPNFSLGNRSTAIEDPKMEGSFEFEGDTWNWTIPPMQQRLSHKGQRMAYVSSVSDRRKLPATLGPWNVLRPEHRSNPFIGWKVYRNPGAVVSDEPYTYLTVYANAKMTLSDRVHACVVAAAYGNPVMLYGTTPRSALFERMGLGGVRKTIVQLPEERRVQERDALLSFLKTSLASV